ncbi:techylectin-5B-like [Limulus polyphemus]|uniref:Techylectin-5B-like n=1 Tax=Limulus polyphemus TaxID=6850 RepID=A0ABM1BS73_LIMPO|nr:techylectin-5B-like [Limulus polyphemus]
MILLLLVVYEGLFASYMDAVGFSLDHPSVNCKPEDCNDVRQQGFYESGVYRIWPRYYNKPVQVFCDMTTDGGGWTVIQRRDDIEPRQDFYQPWEQYKHGFGNLTGEFWLGNDLIFVLTNKENMILRIDMKAFNGERKHARYQNFLVRSERDLYNMTVGSYDGTAGDSLSYHSGFFFSTKDKDNDQQHSHNCAEKYGGGWWFKRCLNSNLNGLYQPDEKASNKSYTGIAWYRFRNSSHFYLRSSEMKIRPEF